MLPLTLKILSLPRLYKNLLPKKKKKKGSKTDSPSSIKMIPLEFHHIKISYSVYIFFRLLISLIGERVLTAINFEFSL